MLRLNRPACVFVGTLVAIAAPPTRADALHDWNAKMVEIVAAARVSPPAATRVTAVVQTAVYDAVNAITRRYPTADSKPRAPDGASVEAAIAAANHSTLGRLLPAQSEPIAAAYRTALADVPDGPAKSAGVALGEAAAASVLARAAGDGAAAGEAYRPFTAPGTYVPTPVPAGLQWTQRRPWGMDRADQFRPGPPPDLKSGRWAADYNEIKALGARTSTRRTTEQTDIARFWEATGSGIYFPIVRSITTQHGRDLTRNARLLAQAAQAMDDAYIAVFDAKYHYSFWRPITAIRNGDLDGNDATERDASWLPLIDTPMHPEYPCAHCIGAAAVAAVVREDVGEVPLLSTRSATAPGVVRSWTRLEDFVREVGEARIWGGVHYRYATEVGTAMGVKVGVEVARRHARDNLARSVER
jgi:PAP2 superfamily